MSPRPCSGNVPLHQVPRAACRRDLIPRTASYRGRVPRTRVIALHSLIPRPAKFINNITMPRSVRRLRRAPFYYFKQIARALHPTFRRVVAACRRGHVPRERCPLCLIPRTGVIALHGLLRGQRRVAAAMFRERALLHCTTLFRGQRRRICFCGAHGIILSLAQNRGFCANERRQRSAVASRVLRGLLKAEFAGAIVYFFLPGFAVAKSCFANHTSIALFIIRLVITEYVVFTIM